MKHTPLSNKHAKPNAFDICMSCYSTDFDFVRYDSTKVKIVCRHCGKYYRWAHKDEYAGKNVKSNSLM